MTITDEIDLVKTRLTQTKLDNPTQLTEIFYQLRTYRQILSPFLTKDETEKLQIIEQSANKNIILHKKGKKSQAMNILDYYETSLRSISEREIKTRSTRTELKNG
jgi:hypothetical protein